MKLVLSLFCFHVLIIFVCVLILYLCVLFCTVSCIYFVLLWQGRTVVADYQSRFGYESCQLTYHVLASDVCVILAI